MSSSGGQDGSTLVHPAPAPAQPAPEQGAVLSRRRRLVVVWSLVASTVLAGLVVLGLPFAPVDRTTATVQWPAQGQAVESTMLPLVPYRPLTLDAQMPCAPQGPAGSAVRQPTVLFSTFPVWLLTPGKGLTVFQRGSTVSVVLEGRSIHTGRVPADGCRLDLQVGTDRTRVLLDGAVVADVDVEPPRVASLATSLPVGTPGLSARLALDSRFETSPAPVKQALIGLGVLAAAVAVGALAAADPSRRARLRRPRLSRSRLPQDLLVLATLGTWLVVGPTTSDDGYNIAIAENAQRVGFIGNYYHWYNAPEAPFALVHSALVPLVELTRAPVLLRVPALLAGIAVWWLLTRVVLPRLRPAAGVAAQAWVAVPVFLAWWLPFNNNLRPEPWVALAGAVVLACALVVLQTRRLLLLAVASAAVGIAIGVAPTGLMAAAPLLVLAPRLLRLLRAGPLPAWLTAAALLVPAAVVCSLAFFADQPFGAVREATRMHEVIGPSLDWWDEIVRYQYLFASSGEMGNFARRSVVLVTLLCLVLVFALRHSVRTSRDGGVVLAAQCLGLALVLLVLAPSKWTHHFGGTIPYAVPLVVGAVLHAPRALLRERRPAVFAGVLTVVTAGAVAAGFGAPNTWSGYGSLHVDPQLPGWLAHPASWLAGAAVLVGILVLRRGAAGGPSVDGAGPVSVGRRTTALSLAPVVVVLLGTATSVVVMIATQVSAAASLEPGWSTAGQNLRHLSGGTCGMGDSLEVLVPEPTPVASGTETQTTAGAFAAMSGSLLPKPVSLSEATRRWGTFGALPGPPEAVTGTLTTPFFRLTGPAADELGVVVAGRTGGANSVVLEFAGAERPDQVLGRVELPGRDDLRWRQVPVEVPQDSRIDRVRVVATDGSTDAGGWLAVSQPVGYRATTLPELARERPVHIDFALRPSFPCLPAPAVAHGMAQAPDVFVSVAPRADASVAAGLAADEDLGGSLAMAFQASTAEVLPSRLPFVSDEAVLRGQDLGTVVLWQYPLPRDRFDLTLGTERVSGLQWEHHYPVPIPVEPLELPGPRLVDKGPDAPQVDTRVGVQPALP